MPEDYDLVVIGAGTAAMTAATRVRAAGKTVAVTDFRPFGGTCALRGCDPKKMLIAGTSTVDHLRRMRGHGVAGDVRINWTELMAFKRGFTDPVPQRQERTYAEKGIDTFHARARFTGPNALDIGGVAVNARHVLLASGAEPVQLNVPGEELLATNEEFLNLEALPARIVLVGGGYIAAEFSNIAALAGAHVTVLQQGDRMLKGFDADLVGLLMQKLSSLGIDVQLKTQVTKVEKSGTAYIVFARRGGQELTFEADLVVHAGGRAPNLAPLDLAAGGVDLEDGRLKLNEYLQSVSNPAVYAAGDAAQMGPPLTPVSTRDARAVATNILQGNTSRPDYRAVPTVAFTSPPIAAVGLSEEEARQRGLRFRVKTENVSSWFTARQAAEPTYGYKTLVEEGSDLLLGAHIVGPHADEVINLFAMAMRHGLTATDIKSTVFAYPTGASDVGHMV
ncbi:MAG: NAD(P)/FAD-dependent oxidoreductase [Ramlibacter sp.]|nr:NAD(P)/FAD-dependent oxidoreductase [Ramlibacter sp.]